MAFIDDTRLFTVLTRHAIYVEAVKSNQAAKFNDTLQQLEQVILKLFSRLKYPTLDALTKAQLNAFVIELKTAQRKIYSVYTQSILDDIAEFMRGDLFVQRGLMAALALPTGEQEPVGAALGDVDADEVLEDDAKKNNLALAWFWRSVGGQAGPLAAASFPASFQATAAGNTVLSSTILNTISPADGQTITGAFANFTAAATLAVINIVKRGYVNGDSKDEIISQIVGSDALRNVDGVLNKTARNAATLTHTVLQQVTSQISEGVQKAFYNFYQWISVMDDRTSAICIHRNLMIYEYGKGPIPPAHYRCRSKIVPTFQDDGFEPPPIDEWLDEDESDVGEYATVVKGKVTIKKSLSVQDFIGKTAEMLRE